MRYAVSLCDNGPCIRVGHTMTENPDLSIVAPPQQVLADIRAGEWTEETDDALRNCGKGEMVQVLCYALGFEPETDTSGTSVTFLAGDLEEVVRRVGTPGDGTGDE